MTAATMFDDLPLAPTAAPLGEDLPAVLERLARSGFRHVQLSATQSGYRPRELDRSARRALAALLRRLELSVSGLDAWIPPEHFLDPAHCDRAVEAIHAAIELAADLGRCPLSFVWPPDSSGDNAPAIVKAIAAHADRFGVRIADHGVPQGNHDWFGAGIDPAAFLAAEFDPAAGVHAASARLAAARLCDLSATGARVPIILNQAGRLDVLAYRAALSVAAYRRPVVLDARQWNDPWTGLTQSVAAWTITV